MVKNRYDLVIDNLTKKYKTELMAEEETIDYNYLFVESNHNLFDNFSSLSELPIEKVLDFKVSKISFFKDDLWDWRDEGSSMYKDSCSYSWNRDITDGISLLAPENKYLCYLLKMIGFYSLPPNACLQNITSFNSSKMILKDLQLVGQFLYKNRLFIDIQGNGKFTNTVYLTKEHFLDFINNDLKGAAKVYSFAKQVKHWVGLSKSELIPFEFRLNFEPFDKEMYSRLLKNAEDVKKEYLPISIETLSELIPYSIDYIENKYIEAFKLYSILWPIIAGGKFAKAESFDWVQAIEQLKKQNLSSLGNEDLHDKSKVVLTTKNLITELRNACVTILFLVTGMRRSEMYLLEFGDCWKVEGTEDDFRIRTIIPKTSEGSTGDPVVLPVPKIAFEAFKCLETLTEKARFYGKSNKLMISTTSSFGKEISIGSINGFLAQWCKKLEIENIHPHQFRKTLAMFVIYQNPNNISLIKRLFSHKSLAMTLAYIVKMPGMDEEIKLAVIEKNKELLIELLEALDKKCIGGKAGTRIQRLANEQALVKAKLNDDGWEGLDQYIQILLQDGLNILHRTSFGAICTNTHSALVHLAPETCNCNVTDCNWSVFTVNSIDDLQDTIKFHQDFVESDFSSEEQKRFSNKTIKDCFERLYELKGLDYVKMKFPDFVNENSQLIGLWRDNNNNQDIKA